MSCLHSESSERYAASIDDVVILRCELKAALLGSSSGEIASDRAHACSLFLAASHTTVEIDRLNALLGNMAEDSRDTVASHSPCLGECDATRPNTAGAPIVARESSAAATRCHHHPRASQAPNRVGPAWALARKASATVDPSGARLRDHATVPPFPPVRIIYNYKVDLYDRVSVRAQDESLRRNVLVEAGQGGEGFVSSVGRPGTRESTNLGWDRSKFGRNVTNLGQHWPRSDQVWPTWAQVRPDLARFRPVSTKLGRDS